MLPNKPSFLLLFVNGLLVNEGLDNDYTIKGRSIKFTPPSMDWGGPDPPIRVQEWNAVAVYQCKDNKMN